MVPVGEDQLPIIEQTNELVRAFNRTYKTDVLVEAEAIIPPVARLVGLEGKAKMSKSLGNAIFLSDSADAVTKKVMSMYTDPDHSKVESPGKVEGNVVFTYLDVFAPDKKAVEAMKEHYRAGGLGDVTVKKYLADVLNTFLDPIRAKRAQYAKDKEYIYQVLREGTEKTYAVAQCTMDDIRRVTGLRYF